MRVRYPHRPGRPARRAWACSLLLVALLAGSRAHAQAAYQPEFDLEVVSARAEEGPGSRVDVYTAIPYSNLRFLAQAEGFEANYTVTVEVYRADERGRAQGLAATRAWERAVRVPTYTGTQQDSLEDVATQTLPLEPGLYAVEVTVEDAASRRTFVRERALTVGRYDGALGMSDPLLLDRYDRAERRIYPNVGATVAADRDALTLFYEVYAAADADVQVTYTVTEQNRVRERPSARALLGLSPREQTDAGVPFVLSEALAVRAGRNPATLRVPLDRLAVGEFTLGVRLETPDGALVAETLRPFTVQWTGLDTQIRDVEAAIAQLRYVARDREIRAIREAPTPEARMELFRAFWDRRDPTPGTRRNERMEEYYFRVSFANERYGRFSDAGWNTDRGEVYIRFGEPDFVEEHPFSYGDKPYEVWFYNRVGRRFIFVDQNGLGDYRLVVPIWDERTRM